MTRYLVKCRSDPYENTDCFDDLDRAWDLCFNLSEEYAYVWEEGFWSCYNLHQFDDQEPEIVEIPQVL